MENREPGWPAEVGPGPPPHLADSPEEGLLGEAGWPIHSLAVILGAPASAVDVDVVGVQAQRACLYRICHLAIQHAYPWPRRGQGEGCCMGPAARGTSWSTPSPAPRGRAAGETGWRWESRSPDSQDCLSLSKTRPKDGKKNSLPSTTHSGSQHGSGFPKEHGDQHLPCKESEWMVRT